MSFTVWFSFRDLDFIHAYERIPYNNWLKISSPIYTAVITRGFTPTAHSSNGRNSPAMFMYFPLNDPKTNMCSPPQKKQSEVKLKQSCCHQQESIFIT